MLFQIVGVLAVLIAAGISGVQFAKLFRAISGESDDGTRLTSRFAYALGPAMIPFMVGAQHKLGACVGFFIGATALVTLLVGASDTNQPPQNDAAQPA